jgi:hypothetical protein
MHSPRMSGPALELTAQRLSKLTIYFRPVTGRMTIFKSDGRTEDRNEYNEDRNRYRGLRTINRLESTSYAVKDLILSRRSQFP